jgi:hypothetical protein
MPFQKSRRHIFDQTGAFRLIKLHPALSFNAPLECELIQSDYEEASQLWPPYEAVSYYWGDDQSGGNIHYTRPDCYITLRKNAYNALRQLRQPTRSRILWIDVLCVDQNNERDKLIQIERMGRIFNAAMRVIAYIGELDHTTTAFLRCLSGSATSHQTRKDIRNFIAAHEWFRRGWVIQEILLARSICIRCGSVEIPWAKFYHLYETSFGLPRDIQSHELHEYTLVELYAWYREQQIQHSTRGYYERHNEESDDESDEEDMTATRAIGVLPLSQLFDLLIVTRKYGFSKKVDRVFALLSLFEPSRSISAILRTTYTSSLIGVLTDAVQLLLLDQSINPRLSGWLRLYFQSRGDETGLHTLKTMNGSSMARVNSGWYIGVIVQFLGAVMIGEAPPSVFRSLAQNYRVKDGAGNDEDVEEKSDSEEEEDEDEDEDQSTESDEDQGDGIDSGEDTED